MTSYSTTYRSVDLATGQRLQPFEVVDKSNADALWEQHDSHTSRINKACSGIREMDKGMFSLNDASTILSTLSAKLYEAGFNEVADEIDVIAGEIEP